MARNGPALPNIRPYTHENCKIIVILFLKRSTHVIQFFQLEDGVGGEEKTSLAYPIVYENMVGHL